MDTPNPQDPAAVWGSKKVWSARKPTRLCVDDDADGLDLRSQFRTHVGYEVIITTVPAEVLNIIDHHAPDIVIIDYHMPQMNGAVLSAMIKQKRPELKIVLLSGSAHVPEGDLIYVDSYELKGEGVLRLLEVLSVLLDHI